MKAAGEIAISNTEGISIDFATNRAMISGKEDRSRTELWKAQAPKGQLHRMEESLRLITEQKGGNSFCSVFVFAEEIETGRVDKGVKR